METTEIPPTVREALEQIEHPEIAQTLFQLGMLLDAALHGATVHVALALPKYDIPQTVKEALQSSIQTPLEKLGYELNLQFFEMQPQVRDRFFTLAKANWKGSV